MNFITTDIESSLSFIKAFGIKAFFVKAINTALTRPYRRCFKGSYSQNYEDIIVDRVFGQKESGFYVDVGANDPLRSNNTMRFYKRGWRGINIEPDPECFKRIESKRLEDINLNIGIGRDGGENTFYRFAPATRSTFSRAKAQSLMDKGLELKEKINVKTFCLSEILEEYCSEGIVDFLSVDTEGYDEEVLSSNNWNIYKPSVICIESAGTKTIQRILTENDYEKVADTKSNSIYRLREIAI